MKQEAEKFYVKAPNGFGFSFRKKFFLCPFSKRWKSWFGILRHPKIYLSFSRIYFCCDKWIPKNGMKSFVKSQQGQFNFLWHFLNGIMAEESETSHKKVNVRGNSVAMEADCEAVWLDWRWWCWLILPVLTSTSRKARQYVTRRRILYSGATQQSDRTLRQASVCNSPREPDPTCRFSWSLPWTIQWFPGENGFASPPRWIISRQWFLCRFSAKKKAALSQLMLSQSPSLAIESLHESRQVSFKWQLSNRRIYSQRRHW